MELPSRPAMSIHSAVRHNHKSGGGPGLGKAGPHHTHGQAEARTAGLAFPIEVALAAKGTRTDAAAVDTTDTYMHRCRTEVVFEGT